MVFFGLFEVYIPMRCINMAEKEKKEVKGSGTNPTTNAKQDDSLLNETLKEIERAYGKGSVMRLGDRPTVEAGVIPTGSLMVDHALGVGGYPKGRIIEIFGPESSGKTTLALQAIAQVQKMGGRAAFVDAEHAIDPDYAKALGVDVNNLILSQPDYGEQALDIVDILAKGNAFDLIVVDSVAALVPRAELEGTLSDQSVGLQARLMSKALRKLAGQLNKSNCSVIFINQLREKVGVMFGNPETTSGGRALKFYASVRIDIRKAEAIKDGDVVIGNVVNVKIVKNKVAPPYKSCRVDMIYGQGLSHLHELANLALGYGIIKKSGSWFNYGEERLGQGTSALLKFLTEKTTEADKIEKAIRENLANGVAYDPKLMK